jgi:Tol biopolymer transport system component
MLRGMLVIGTVLLGVVALLTGAAVTVGAGLPTDEIAFFRRNNDTHNAQIYLLDARRGLAHRLTHAEPPRNFDYPVWSPAGDRLALYELSTASLYVLTLADMHLRQITDPELQSYSPAWSPDGGTLAFLRDERLHTLDLTTGELTVLTDAIPRLLYLDWSPDGETIIGRGGDGIVRIDSVSGDVGRWRLDVGARYHLLNVAWSPDGEQIALAMALPGDPYRIYTLSVGENTPQPLTDHAYDTSWPSWSPTGTQLVYWSLTDGANYDIYMIDAAGGASRRLTTAPDDDRSPAWRPR